MNNFPTHCIIDGEFRQILEETGMSVKKEVETVALARKMDLFTIDSVDREAGGMATVYFMAEPGYEYRAQYSSDLVTWHDDLAAGLMESGDSVLMMGCEDPGAAGSGRRFYRILRSEK